MSEDIDDRKIEQCHKNAAKIARILFELTKGRGADVVLTMAITLACLEAQHEGTITDIVSGAEIAVKNIKASVKALEALEALQRPDVLN